MVPVEVFVSFLLHVPAYGEKTRETVPCRSRYYVAQMTGHIQFIDVIDDPLAFDFCMRAILKMHVIVMRILIWLHGHKGGAD